MTPNSLNQDFMQEEEDVETGDFSRYGGLPVNDYRKFRKATTKELIGSLIEGAQEGITSPYELARAGFQFSQGIELPESPRIDLLEDEQREQPTLGMRAARYAGNVIGSSPYFGGKLAQMIVPSAAGFVARELGAGPIGEILSAVGGGLAQEGVKSGTKALTQLAKETKGIGAKEKLARGLAKFVEPKSDAEALYKATEGNAPLTTLVKDSKGKTWVESLLTKHPAAAEAYAKQSERTIDAFKGNIRKAMQKEGITLESSIQESAEALDNAISSSMKTAKESAAQAEDALVSKSKTLSFKPIKSIAIAEREAPVIGSEVKEFVPKAKLTTRIVNPIREVVPKDAPSKLSIADSISKSVKASEDAANKQTNALWKTVREKIKPSDSLPQEARSDLIKEIDDFVKSVASSRKELQPYEKDAVIEYANKARNLAKSAKFGKMPVREVIDTIQLGNEIYGGKEGYKKLALSVKSRLDSALEKWGADNKEAYRAYRDAVDATREKKNTFTKEVLGITKRKGKETAFPFFTRESGINFLRKVLPKEEFGKIHDSISNYMLSEKFGRKAIGEYIKGKDPKAFTETILHEAGKLRGIISEKKLSALEEAARKAQAITTKESALVSIPANKLIDTIFSLEKKLASKDLSPTKRKSIEDFLSAVHEDIGAEKGPIKKLISQRNAALDVSKKLESVYDKKEGIQTYIKNSLKGEKKLETLKNELKGVPHSEELIQQGQKALLAEELEKKIFSKDTFGKKELNFIRELHTNPETRKLIGPDGVKALQEIEKHANDIISNVSFYANPSGTEVMRTNKSLLLGYGAGMMHLFSSGNPLLIISAFGAHKGPEVVAKLLTDPEFKRAFLDASKKVSRAKMGSKDVERQLLRLGKYMAQVAGKQALVESSRQ